MGERDDTQSTPGWRGYAVVMFVDLCGYTSLNEQYDPEDVDLLRRQVAELVTSVVQKHGGSVNQAYGDGFLAVFGHPVARENDARHAVAAAIEIHRATRELRCGEELDWFEPRMHTGLHNGVLFAGRGDSVQGLYALTGDVVNTAARLCAVAGQDEILISDAMRSEIDGLYEVEPTAEPLSLKGKRAPMRAHRVTARSEALTRYDARARNGVTKLVGRETELAELDRALREARAGSCQLLVVSGAPGLGKSRLLAELRQRSGEQGFRVLSGACESYDDAAPIAPIEQVLKQLFGLQHAPEGDPESAVQAQLHSLGASEADAALLTQLMFPRTTPGTRAVDPATQQTVVRAVTTLLEAVARHSPVALTLDDWQWADDSSRILLDGLAQSLAALPVCIVIATRPVEHSDPLLARIATLELSPLDEEQSAQVVQTLRFYDPDREVARALHRRSGGNPLFLEELCRVLPSAALHDEKALAESGAPSTLHGAIQARVAMLPESHSRVLRIASVIGIEFTESLLTALCPEPPLPEVLLALAKADLIHVAEPAATFRFKHGITREVIYESVLVAERRRLHAAVASVIRAGRQTEQLADEAETLVYHYRSAGNYEFAVPFAELAGAKAMATSALDRARFHYTHALQALNKLPRTLLVKQTWLRITPQWVLACAYNSARSHLELLELADTYAAELGEPGAQAHTQYAGGWILYGLGEYRAALARYETALRLAESAGRPKLVEQLWANIGQAHAAAGDYHEALPMLTRSIESKRSRAAPSKQVAQGYAYALAARASVHADSGDFEAATRDFEDALAAVHGLEHPIEASVLAHAAMVQLRRGDWQRAADLAHTGLAISERLRSPFVHATLTAYEAYAHWKQREQPDALNRLAEAVKWLEQRDQGLFISLAYGFLAEALLAAGELEHARACAEQLLQRAEHGDRLGETAALRVLSALHRPDDPLLADELLARASTASQERGALRDVAETELFSLESRPRDAQAAEALRERFSAWGMHWHAARAMAAPRTALHPR